MSLIMDEDQTRVHGKTEEERTVQAIYERYDRTEREEA